MHLKKCSETVLLRQFINSKGWSPSANARSGNSGGLPSVWVSRIWQDPWSRHATLRDHGRAASFRTRSASLLWARCSRCADVKGALAVVGNVVVTWYEAGMFRAVWWLRLIGLNLISWKMYIGFIQIIRDTLGVGLPDCHLNFSVLFQLNSVDLGSK